MVQGCGRDGSESMSPHGHASVLSERPWLCQSFLPPLSLRPDWHDLTSNSNVLVNMAEILNWRGHSS